MIRVAFWASLLLGCAAARATREASAPPAAAPVDEPAAAAPAVQGATSGERTIAGDPIAEAQLAVDDAARALQMADADCTTLCKALSSMTAATDRLCALVGSDPVERERCTAARVRVETAQDRIKLRGCACG
jgi:hypothetical protein